MTAILKKAKQWLTDTFDKETQQEIQQLTFKQIRFIRQVLK